MFRRGLTPTDFYWIRTLHRLMPLLVLYSDACRSLSFFQNTWFNGCDWNYFCSLTFWVVIAVNSFSLGRRSVLVHNLCPLRGLLTRVLRVPWNHDAAFLPFEVEDRVVEYSPVGSNLGRQLAGISVQRRHSGRPSLIHPITLANFAWNRPPLLSRKLRLTASLRSLSF